MGVQLNHAGASASSSRIGMQPVSASELPSKPGGEKPRPLTREELFSIAKDYGAAAKRAVNAGFDLIELHVGHSYLISQFLSPTMNERTDEFGGSPENRAHFCRMVIDEVRSAIGPNIPIFLRFSTDELLKGGNNLEDCLKYLEYLNDEVDIFDTFCGLNQTIQYQIDACWLEDGWRSYMAKAVRDKFGKPSIAMGNIRNPQAADDIIARGDADMIGLGRGLIADPDWPNKAKYSDILDIRKCISCNTGCVGNRIGGNRPIRCAINPDLINGEAYRKLKVAKPCNAVVVGGGAVGLDAMEFFAPKGAEVTIVEMMSVIGRDLDASTISAMRECMAKYDVKQMTNTALQIVKPHSFVVKLKDGNREELPFDYGFICLGMRAYAPIWKAIQQGFKGTDTEILNIGDSVRARRIIDGTDAGRHLVLKTLERRVFLL